MPWRGRRHLDEQEICNRVGEELPALRAALDDVPFGIVLLDSELRAQFINRAFRKMWRLPDSKADAKPAYIALLHHGRDIRAYDVPESEVLRLIQLIGIK